MVEATDLGTCLVSLFCTQTHLLIRFVTLFMGDTLFWFCSFSLFFFLIFPPFCTHTLFLKQLLMLPQHTHSHTRSSAQCLGNTRKATLDRIDTQKEDWVSKVARYTFEACKRWGCQRNCLELVAMSSKSSLMRKLVVVTKITKKRDNKQQRNLPNEKEKKSAEMGRTLRSAHAGHSGSAGHSGRCAPDTPVSWTLFVDLAEIPAQIPQIRGEIGKIGG